jgi:hypothetical protein
MCFSERGKTPKDADRAKTLRLPKKKHNALFMDTGTWKYGRFRTAKVSAGPRLPSGAMKFIP